MRTRTSVLARFVDLPDDPRALRDLLDDVGLEVKRLDPLPDGDLSLTLELLANRGDHHGLHGLAREIAGRTGATVRLPPVRRLTVGESPVPVLVESDGCLRYGVTLLERGEPGSGALTAASLAPILAAEQGPVSAPVDATNLANLELGQPTHAFDADAIVGPIRVRDSRPGEHAWPLFAAGPVPLPEGTLVIADDEKVLAVAGVIGCEESKTTPETRRVLLESATFDPVRVRKAARALDLATDSSARFERGADPSAVLEGAGRVAHLLCAEAGWQIVGTTGLFGDWTDPQRQIPLSVAAAASFLEHPLQADEIATRLGRFGFRVSGTWPDWAGEDPWRTPPALDDLPRERLRNYVLVLVPPHRLWDVAEPADLLEELARSIGYNATPERLPPVDLGSLPSPAEERQARLVETMLGLGFHEVVVDGFHGRDLVEKLGLPDGHPLTAHVSTLNALDRGYSLLKNSPLPQALDGVATNLHLRYEHVRAFELTRTFHPDRTAANRLCVERPVAWAIATGADRPPTWDHRERPIDVFALKGVVEELAVALQLDLHVAQGAAGPPVLDLLHPGRRATILLGDRPVGALGEVHPRIVAAYKIKRARPVYLELDLEPLLTTEASPRPWTHPTTLQPIERSLAFTLPLGVPAGAVIDALRASGPPWLDAVRATDLFAHEVDGRPVRTVTFSLRFDTAGGPRTGDEVNAACDALIGGVTAALGDRGVRLRA